jgi:hypothetical protein
MASARGGYHAGMDHHEEDEDPNLIEPEGVDSGVPKPDTPAAAQAKPAQHGAAPEPHGRVDPVGGNGDNGSLLSACKPDNRPQPGQQTSVGEGWPD